MLFAHAFRGMGLRRVQLDVFASYRRDVDSVR
jgi:hypothetical protein